MGYVPLWVKSNFSFLEGASHPAQLVERAHALGLPGLALTDRDGVYGLVRAHVRARQLGLRILAGAQITLGSDPACARHVVALAENRQGYGQLTSLLSLGRAHQPKGQSLVSLDELCTATDHIVLLCPDRDLLAELYPAFADRLYALITRHRLAAEPSHEHRLRQQASRLGIPTVAAVEVLYHSVACRPLQDVLTCIRAGTTLGTAGTLLRPNAEHELLSIHAMNELFADDLPSVERTLEVAQRCTFSLSELRYRYPAERLPDGLSQTDWLRQRTWAGATKRYGAVVPQAVREQLERELELIGELDYGGYFLTMAEIVEYCHAQGILCQGRGSAANSAVCFCLSITAIDPVRMDLLFERFLSRERAEPPDIDLDIEHERREEVIQWVYGRYGRRHAAMVANVIRYRARSAVRDVGKALGLPQTALDRLAKQLGHYDTTLSPDAIDRGGLDPRAPGVARFFELVGQIADFPRHLSIHPGGFLLGHDPVDTLVPIEPATMPGRTVIQWDKYDVDDLGLFKLDLLGLGALTMIRKCFALLAHHQRMVLDMATIPAEDPATYAMISRADTIGVFQIESRAQMSMLPRLRPQTFYDLVIQVAIVRPGPIQGDMVHPYLRRRSGEEPVEFPHPLLQRALAKTLGVPIFQEQVMKLAMLVADYTPGEADQLRRDMGAWRSSGRIEQHHGRLVPRMIANGIPEEFAERVFAQIRGFGEYGFPESHAASFALLAYVTAWLRCHHLAAFTAAALNSQPMGFYAPSTIVDDAKRHGVEVRPIDINYSRWDCSLERRSDWNAHENAASGDLGEAGGRSCVGHTTSADQRRQDRRERRSRAHSNLFGAPEPAEPWAVRMGLRYLKGFGVREHQLLDELLRLPNTHPTPRFGSLEALVRQTRLGAKALHTLAEAGALASFGLSRRDAIWRLRGLAGTIDDRLSLGADISEIQPQFAPIPRGEAILWDYRTSMHSTLGHPLTCIRPALNARGLPLAEQVTAMPSGAQVDYVGLVICRQQPGTASGVTFYTLEDETGFVNVVVWKQVFDTYRWLARTALVLGVRGRLQVHDRAIHLVAETLWDPELRMDGHGVAVRSFH